MEELVKKLNYYTKLYDEGHPEISDEEWDNLYFQLADMERESGIILPDSPTNKVNYYSVNKLEKVEHNHFMGSLAKTKDWNEFIQYFGEHSVIGTCKLDGLTCSLRYLNGKLVSAETRGNGFVGENILHNALVIKNIPKKIDCKEELIIDGEVICKIKNFDRFSNEYSNPRNFAAGSIRLLDSNECNNRSLSFIAWNLIKGDEEERSYLKRLVFLEDLGFEVTPWTSSFDWDAKEFLINSANELSYPIDGLVGWFDDIDYGRSLGNTGHHAKQAYAFKFYDETYQTNLLDIEWTPSRSGQLTPVALFSPVDTGSSTIERASLHNINILHKILGDVPRKNSLIEVCKQNEIIPQVVKIVANGDEEIKIPNICPYCGQDTIIENDNLYCSNDSCESKLINRIDHYCGKRGMDIKGLSKATLEKLIDWEWVDSIIDIYSLGIHKEKWINKQGFGQKSVDNILNAIKESKTCELYSFISAIGIPLIGINYAKQLAAQEEDWYSFRDKIDKKYDFSQLEGFGIEMNKAIHNFDYTEADKIAQYLKMHNSMISAGSTTLDGITVCVTGKSSHFKNRDELTTAITQLGGKVTSSVTTKTTYLINNDIESNSSKNLTAKKLGIEILSEEKFIEKFLQI